MTEEEINILTSESVRTTIRKNLDKDPAFFALSQKDNSFPVSLVSTQLKYLQKAKYKLPTYYNHLCIIPPLAYQQSSSEEAASLKEYSGHRCLDLTMGLGVDSVHLSNSFEEVISLDTNEGLVRIAQKNFQLIGRNNIHPHHQSASSFLSAYEGPPFDLVYVDPARRDEKGQRIHDLEACLPNVIELMPLIQKHASRIVIKASPLYDINEARKKITSLDKIIVHSLNNEVKELILEVDRSIPSSLTKTPHIEAVISQKGRVSRFSFDWDDNFDQKQTTFDPPQFLYEPDVAFYKIRKVRALFSRYFKHLPGYITQKAGFFLAMECLTEGFPGRIFRINEKFAYKPKELRRYLSQAGIKKAHLLCRNFPFSVQKMRNDLKVKEGGDIYLIGTQLEGKNVIFATERLQ